MATLKDLLVNGPSRFIGDLFASKAQLTSLDAPTSAGGTAYGPGTSGQVLKSDGTSIYWGADNNSGGTVTSIQIQATSPVQSSTNTAQTATLNTTISLADGYGDTKNPYASKTKNYVLAAPSSANGAPTFRALVADDIPTLSITDKTSGTLTVARGGTNKTSWTQYGLIYASATDTLAQISTGTSGYVLQSGGSSGAPSWINATNSSTASTIVKRDANGNFSAGTITASLSGNASTATTLQTARTIDGVSFNGGSNIIHYGICSTGASTSIKTASITGFTLENGAIAYIKFNNTNTATTPQLNINSTGAKYIFDQHGVQITGVSNSISNYLQANKIYQFIYDSDLERYIIINVPKTLELYEKRSLTTDLNKTAGYGGIGAMFHLVSTSSTTTGAPPTNANILQMNWDNDGGYDSQFGIATAANRAYFRSAASSSTAWQEIAHAAAGTQIGSSSQPVYLSDTGIITAITGALANNITGNAATATKLGTVTVGSTYNPIYLNEGVATTTSGYTVEFIRGTQTASTGSWTGVTKDAALYDGKMIMYVLPYAGDGNAYLNLTLSTGATTGAKAIYRYGATTRITTHFSAGSRILLIYDASGDRWNASAYYDSNTNTLQRTYRSATNIELPIAGVSTTGSATTAYSAISSGSYKDVYGAIPETTTNVATINPSTGKITVPGGISTSNIIYTNYGIDAPSSTTPGYGVAGAIYFQIIQ